MIESRIKKNSPLIKFGGMEYRILWAVCLLLGFGLIMTFDLGFYSTSRGTGEFNFLSVWKFLATVVIGIGILVFLSRTNERGVFWTGMVLLAGSVVFLTVAMIQGHHVYGAARWCTILGIRFQPVEIFKIAIAIGLAIALAREFDSKSGNPRGIYARIFFWLCLLAGLVLINLQPNHSALVTIIFVVFIVVLMSRIKWQYVVVPALVALVIVGIVLWNIPEKRDRILAWLHRGSTDESISLSEERYQAERSWEAVASGSWIGKGIGRSIIKHSLPASSTDFVFAIIVEELGVVGGGLLLLCYLYLIMCAFSVAKYENNEFMRLMGVAVTLFFAVNVVVHVAVNLDLAPTTGIPLPFISQGGTALLFHLISIGLILNLAHKRDLESSIIEINQEAFQTS